MIKTINVPMSEETHKLIVKAKGNKSFAKWMFDKAKEDLQKVEK
jgi:hypothetical protein